MAPPPPTSDGSLPDAANLAYAEALYRRWLDAPEDVPEAWRRHFESQVDEEDLADATSLQSGPSWPRTPLFHSGNGKASVQTEGGRQHAFDRLVHAYRVRGHRAAALDPLGRPTKPVPELDPAFHGLGPDQMEEPVFTTYAPPEVPRRVGPLIQHLERTYCASLGAQFMHIQSAEMRTWIIDKLESEHRPELDHERLRDVFRMLTNAETFESFVQRKFLGAKSFSLEGAETLIPLLHLAIGHAAELGTKSVVLGMGHRGRLNVLAHVLGKDYWRIFREFRDPDDDDETGISGDVKYHLGYSGEHQTPAGPVQTSLCFNPSHLSFVAPVVQGRVRAKQDRFEDTERTQGLGICVHGDGAFSGEGIIQETLNMSRLDAYQVGGMLHVIVNNQIGFTTEPDQGRSTMYASDVATMLQVPIFHVNGEDPEAVARAVRIALEYRAKFRCDAIIDMYCFRRRGHNEGDEPRFTQPNMYREIDKHAGVREAFLESLLEREVVDRAEVDEFTQRVEDELEEHLHKAGEDDEEPDADTMGGVWTEYYGGPDRYQEEPRTGVDADLLRTYGEAITKAPDDLNISRKLARVLDQRRDALEGKRDVDWALAEGLAFASMATRGNRVRMTGQDCERGTFSHRHAVWHDETTGEKHNAFATLDGADVEIANSPLTEMAVLGFEYGYSLDRPDAFVAWEAQFGDFVNCAQVIIDQFLVSAEDKWRRLSGLVMLLPHGYEGQGPEHSSARLERFLALAAEDNIQVAQPTTAAQYFHLLRRQVIRRWRKPLIVMTPKSLLRRREAGSPLDDLTRGTWQRILGDPEAESRDATTVLLCSGKVAFELLARRDVKTHAVIRFEQLYPLSDEEVESALAKHPNATEVVWVQEEPANMGAWPHIRQRFGDTIFGRPLRGVTRPASASPATGSGSKHKREQEDLIVRAVGAPVEKDEA